MRQADASKLVCKEEVASTAPAVADTLVALSAKLAALCEEAPPHHEDILQTILDHFAEGAELNDDALEPLPQPETSVRNSEPQSVVWAPTAQFSVAAASPRYYASPQLASPVLPPTLSFSSSAVVMPGASVAVVPVAGSHLRRTDSSQSVPLIKPWLPQPEPFRGQPRSLHSQGSSSRVVSPRPMSPQNSLEPVHTAPKVESLPQSQAPQRSLGSAPIPAALRRTVGFGATSPGQPQPLGGSFSAASHPQLMATSSFSVAAGGLSPLASGSPLQTAPRYLAAAGSGRPARAI